VKVNGVWRYVYRAIDPHGQVIDVLVSTRRSADAARQFFRRALGMLKVTPSEVVTDAAAVYPAVLDELLPSAWHHVEQYANNPIEANHSQLKHRLRSMRGLHTDRTAQVIVAGTPSLRISAAGITNSASTSHRSCASPQRLPSWLWRSEPEPGRRPNASSDPITQQRPVSSGRSWWSPPCAWPCWARSQVGNAAPRGRRCSCWASVSWSRKR
jgi:hypothetical protein